MLKNFHTSSTPIKEGNEVLGRLDGDADIQKKVEEMILVSSRE